MELTQKQIDKIVQAAEGLQYGSVVIHVSPKGIKIDVTTRLMTDKDDFTTRP
jgi:hypothetical protein